MVEAKKMIAAAAEAGADKVRENVPQRPARGHNRADERGVGRRKEAGEEESVRPVLHGS